MVPGSWLFVHFLFLRCSPFFAGSHVFSLCVCAVSVSQPWLASQVFHGLLNLFPPFPCSQTLPINPCRCRFADGLWGRDSLVQLLRFLRPALRVPGQQCCPACLLPARAGPELRAAAPGLSHRGRKILAAPWPSLCFFCSGSGR